MKSCIDGPTFEPNSKHAFTNSQSLVTLLPSVELEQNLYSPGSRMRNFPVYIATKFVGGESPESGKVNSDP